MYSRGCVCRDNIFNAYSDSGLVELTSQRQLPTLDMYKVWSAADRSVFDNDGGGRTVSTIGVNGRCDVST